MFIYLFLPLYCITPMFKRLDVLVGLQNFDSREQTRPSLINNGSEYLKISSLRSSSSLISPLLPSCLINSNNYGFNLIYLAVLQRPARISGLRFLSCCIYPQSLIHQSTDQSQMRAISQMSGLVSCALSGLLTVF